MSTPIEPSMLTPIEFHHQQEQLLNHQARFAMPGVLIFSQPTDKTYEKQNSDPHLPTGPDRRDA